MCSDNDSPRVGYIGRFVILCVAALGIILSLTTTTGCSFLHFENNSGVASQELSEPFELATEGYIGLFGYEVTKVDFSGVPEKCESYPSSVSFEVLTAGRIVSIAAPIFAVIGVIITLFDTCIGHYFGCFIMSAFMYLIACGLQACTFVLLAEPTFCYDAPHNCSVGSAGIQSAFACTFYWMCTVLTCCFPRPDPYREYRKNPREVRESKTRVERIVTVVEDIQDGFNPNTLEEGGVNQKKKRKPRNGRKSRNAPSSELGSNNDNVDRVELKERKSPDGSRQVDEVTFYMDGSRSIITHKYGPGE